MIDALRSLLDVEQGEGPPVRSVDEIDVKIDELDQALDDPANDFELIANRAARDALIWARGVDSQSVVVDMNAFDQGEA